MSERPGNIEEERRYFGIILMALWQARNGIYERNDIGFSSF